MSDKSLHLIRHFVTPSPQGEGLEGEKSGDTFYWGRRHLGEKAVTPSYHREGELGIRGVTIKTPMFHVKHRSFLF